MPSSLPVPPVLRTVTLRMVTLRAGVANVPPSSMLIPLPEAFLTSRSRNISPLGSLNLSPSVALFASMIAALLGSLLRRVSPTTPLAENFPT